MSPDDLLSRIGGQSSEQEQFIDKNLMPQILSMAKYHVEAINLEHNQVTNGEAKSLSQSSNNQSVKELQEQIQVLETEKLE